MTYFNITQRGKSHIESNDPCQDFSGSIRIHSVPLNKDYIVASISDGVGQCKFSQYGSECVVKSFIEKVSESIKLFAMQPDDEKMLGVIEDAFIYAADNVRKKSKEMELPYNQFDSTLTGVIFDGESLWFGHIGDDGVVVLFYDGTYEMITKRHKGMEANCVVPVSSRNLWQFGKAQKKVASFAMMTDGVLDYCVDPEIMKNRVYFPFLEPILTEVMDTDEKVKAQCFDWEEYLSGEGNYDENFRDRVKDDITFVVVQNSELVSNLPEIRFDIDKWNADSAQKVKELDDSLYGDFKKYKQKYMMGKVKSQKPIEVTLDPIVSSQKSFGIGESSAIVSATLLKDMPVHQNSSKVKPSCENDVHSNKSVLINADVVSQKTNAKKPLIKLGITMYQSATTIVQATKEVVKHNEQQTVQNVSSDKIKKN